MLTISRRSHISSNRGTSCGSSLNSGNSSDRAAVVASIRKVAAGVVVAVVDGAFGAWIMVLQARSGRSA